MAFHWDVDVEKLNFKLYNVHEGNFFVSSPTIDIEFDTKYSKFFKQLSEYIDVLAPIEGGEFSLVYSDGAFFDTISNGKLDIEKDVLNRVFGDSFPSMKKYLYPMFKDIYENDVTKYLTLCFFNEDNLIRYIKMKFFNYAGYVVGISEDITENYYLKINEDKSFDYDKNPKCIIQDNHIVKANKYHMDLFNQTEEETIKITIDDFNKNRITYNDTGLILNYNQIVDKILNNEYNSIIYNIDIDFPEGIKSFQAIAMKTEFDNRIAVYNSVLKELNEVELLDDENFNLFQEYSKSAFVVYDLETNNYSWSQNFEEILEGKLSFDSNIREIIGSLIFPDDLHHLEYVEDNISLEKQVMDVYYRIKTFKGNIKYLHVLNRLIIKDGKIVKFLSIFKDVTDYNLQNKELNRLYDTLKDVQTSTSISIQYETAEGEFTWTPETYTLIDRLPRPDDKSKNIILELTDSDTREEIEKLYDNLKPNEFLGGKKITIITESGKSKILEIDARNIYDSNGEFIQRSAYAQDITEKVILEREKELFSNINAVVLNHLKIGTFILDAEGGSSFSDGFFDIMSIDKKSNLKEIIHNLEDYSVRTDEQVNRISNFFKNNEKDYESTFEYKHPAWINSKFLTIYMVPHEYEGQTLYIGAVQDVTTQIEYESGLLNASAEKTMLIKEVHHRVKNNLQVITSFISLEEKFNNSPGRIVEVTKNRISSLALIHERIYDEDNMNFISLKGFIKDFDDKLIGLSDVKDVNFIEEIDSNLTLPITIMTPIVLIINELTSNTFKHAFDTNDEYKEIFKSIHVCERNDQKMCEFIYKDNGAGLDEEFDINKSPSLGWTIIKSLSNQLDGKYEICPGNGFGFRLTFPYVED